MENTLENNKLIAEFMGFKLGVRYKYQNEVRWSDIWFNEHSENIGKHLLFNTSWDWLIPVVEKIESLYPIVNTKSWTQGSFFDFYIVIPPQFNLHDGNSFGGSFDTKIECVYYAVIEFIKWYNLNPC